MIDLYTLSAKAASKQHQYLELTGTDWIMETTQAGALDIQYSKDDRLFGTLAHGHFLSVIKGYGTQGQGETPLQRQMKGKKTL